MDQHKRHTPLPRMLSNRTLEHINRQNAPARARDAGHELIFSWRLPGRCRLAAHAVLADARVNELEVERSAFGRVFIPIAVCLCPAMPMRVNRAGQRCVHAASHVGGPRWTLAFCRCRLRKG